MTKSSTDVLRRWFEAFERDDMAATRDLFPEEGVLHIDRPSELAGAYRGFDEVLAFFSKKRELSGPSFSYEVVDMLFGERHAAAVIRLTGEIEGVPKHWRQLALYRIEDSQIKEMWFFEPLAEIAAETKERPTTVRHQPE